MRGVMAAYSQLHLTFLSGEYYNYRNLLAGRESRFVHLSAAWLIRRLFACNITRAGLAQLSTRKSSTEHQR